MLTQSIPEALSPIERTHAGAGKETEEEGAAETTCNGWTATPFPVPLRCSEGGGREFGSGVEPMKKGGVGGRSFF